MPTASPTPWPSAPKGEALELGRIADETGAPLAGAIVSLEPWHLLTKTDAGGNYTLRGITIARNCAWGTLTITWTRGAEVRGLVRFNEPYYAMTGRRDVGLRIGTLIDFVGPPLASANEGRAFCPDGEWTTPR